MERDSRVVELQGMMRTYWNLSGDEYKEQRYKLLTEFIYPQAKMLSEVFEKVEDLTDKKTKMIRDLQKQIEAEAKKAKD